MQNGSDIVSGFKNANLPSTYCTYTTRRRAIGTVASRSYRYLRTRILHITYILYRVVRKSFGIFFDPENWVAIFWRFFRGRFQLQKIKISEKEGGKVLSTLPNDYKFRGEGVVRIHFFKIEYLGEWNFLPNIVLHDE